MTLLTMKQALDVWGKGEIVVLVEYRSGGPEPMSWRDKATGRAMSGTIIKHTVEAGNTTIHISQFAPDDFDPMKYTNPFQKGQRLLFRPVALVPEKGIVTGRGELSPLKAE